MSWNRRIPLVFFLLSIGLIGGGVAFAGGEATSMEGKENPMEKATFAGGCFWCMQPPYDKLKGVISTTVGYTGGTKPNPTYDEVSMGKTGHAEAVQITFDPTQISYEKLLDAFWKNIDPTTLNQQFADRGTQYRTAIFYHGEEQKRSALASKEKLEKSGKFKGPLVTEITAASAFYPAEEYHQGYYKKCPVPYQLYKAGSGREGFIQKTWGGDHEEVGKTEKTDEEWKKTLTPEQYRIMREKGTEQAFTGKYWNNKETGMYHCIGCGAPLFSSDTKFDSGTGWPSFFKPENEKNIRYEVDESHGMRRTEVLCKHCGAHLGHLFDDGPGPTGKRFCINSCVLDFKKK